MTNKYMPQSIYRMFAHIVFSTKNREDLIHPEIENKLFGYIHGIIANSNANLVIANGTTNHIHLLTSLPKKIDVSELIGDIKRDSSLWTKKQDSAFGNFYWQRGYGAFSVGQTEIEIVKNYIAKQKEHHIKKDFKTEYRYFLKKYDIEYDERYVWD
ncbi:MAG: IS200/IS605 family transposase [Pyrinomonadaceae bacterium]